MIRGNSRNLRRVSQELRRMPVTVARRVAARAAPAISSLAHASYDGGTNVYGDPRPAGKHGPLSLVRTGWTRDNLRFVSDGGTKIRASLGRRYVRYLIGKYVILPIGKAALPVAWFSRIRTIVGQEASAAVARAR